MPDHPLPDRLPVPPDGNHVLLPVGLPGSGKSTMIGRWRVGRPDLVVCSADDWFVGPQGYRFDREGLAAAHRACRERFLQALQRRSRLIAVDNTNLTHGERDHYLRLALAARYTVTMVVLPVDEAAAVRRNVHDVPADAIAGMVRRLDVRPGIYHILPAGPVSRS